jgi:hypothetical protein
VPDPTGKVSQAADGSVVMTAEYWLSITRYIIDVEAGIAIIESARGLE